MNVWTDVQRVPNNLGPMCSFDIREHWQNGYHVWAGHDCEYYDLAFTLYIQRADYDRIEFINEDADYSDSCENDTSASECALDFFVRPTNPSVGIRFAFDASAAPVELEYETIEWTECVENM